MDKIKEIVDWVRQFSPEGSDLHVDSRVLKPGDVFVAIKGAASDGRSFIDKAIEAGASCILAQSGNSLKKTNVPTLEIEGLPSLLGEIGRVFYHDPSAKMFGIAVTGTNGKTTTVNWISQILTSLGTPCASIGTLGCFFQGQKIPTVSLTTPDPLGLQRLFSQLLNEGCQAFAMEASSIGLEQGRMRGTSLKVAVFTNLSRDHLDYHGTMNNYASAKAKLFRFKGLKAAVINVLGDFSDRMLKEAKQNNLVLYTYGIDTSNGTDITAENVRHGKTGLQFDITYKNNRWNLKTHFLGSFNVENAMAAIGAVLASGFPMNDIVDKVSQLRPPQGRMQKVLSEKGPLVLVDYGHTPDAIEKTLSALVPVRDVRNGKLWILVGAGGDRDHGKRSLMGAAASQADVTVLTSDNPRSEDPQHILSEVAKGAKKEAMVIVDRAEAIKYSISQANTNDVILISGKGHEDYQEIKGIKHHFSDYEQAFQALTEREEQSHG